jgi:serine phosphatase RsbU (regulator of sigma subunit)
MTKLIEMHFPELNALAEAWLASGAVSFSVWAEDKLLRSWQDGHDREAADTTFSAPIFLDGRQLAELRVCGINSEAAHKRLHADAGLISSFLPIEADRKSLARELVDTRDQLVILSDLSNVTRQAINVEKLFKLLAAEIYKLIRVQEVYFVLQIKDRIPLTECYPERDMAAAELAALLAQVKDNQKQAFVVCEMTEGRNLLLVPFHIPGVPIAAMGLVREAACEFTSPEIKLARAFADYTASKTENLLMVQSNVELVRLETEVELARKIQDSLLPKALPVIDGLDIKVASRPASRVGGDFYDFIPHLDRTLDIIVGDVSGKGMPAALLMAMTLKVLRTQTNALSAPAPDLIIERSNAELYNDFSDSVTFSTLFVSTYCPEDQIFTYANAGHSPVIHYPAGGKPRMLNADSIPIGLFPTIHCEKRSLQLGQGDVLVMATDGLNETMNSTNRLFGFTRLMTLTEELAQYPAKEILDGILSEVEKFGSGQDQADDQTLIVVKCSDLNTFHPAGIGSGL